MLKFLSIYMVTPAPVFCSVRVMTERISKLRGQFHRYSLIVWTIWLIPYFGGMMMGMTK